MKKLLYLCLILTILLTGCNKNNEQLDKDSNNSKNVQQQYNQSNATSDYVGKYQISNDQSYYNYLKNNPIDYDYKKEYKVVGSSTLEMVGLESKYAQIWDDELNSIYNKLLSKLQNKEKNLLIESQKGWLQFHINEPKFVNEVFYSRESGPIFGTLGKMQMASVYRERIKERTLELIEYYYLLGNDYTFKYKSKF